ncbi:MAG TPA: CRISPR-associated protein Cas4 [Bacteroidales bacterium]|nr:CRISPR-associated protein Cas4 [Bacteroidales bacterium]
MADNYSDDDLLMLSGVQHFAFCERQWALIHIEQQWSENVLTVEGQHLHERTDYPFENETKKDVITWRALALTSYDLGLSGRADVVELVRSADNDPDSIQIKEKSGRWKIIPVEYKRGKPKPDECDEVQLCAQAMCLEEMYNVHITEGYLYYGTTRHRHNVCIDSSLRDKVLLYTKRMHEIYESRITPLSDYKPHCKSCSLIDICLPRSTGNRLSGTDYLKTNLMIQ